MGGVTQKEGFLKRDLTFVIGREDGSKFPRYQKFFIDPEANIFESSSILFLYDPPPH